MVGHNSYRLGVRHSFGHSGQHSIHRNNVTDYSVSNPAIPGAESGVLWWALALGACFGGNGTIIGASANVVTTGIAEKAGYKITFGQFVKEAAPITVVGLFFATVYLFVHIIALKQGMQGLPKSELPQMRQVMKDGWHFLLPLAVLVWLLAMSMSPMRVGYYAVVTMVAVAVMRYALWYFFVAPQQGQPVTVERTKSVIWAGLVKLVEGLELGARNAVAVSMACAVAGIIVGVVGLTGLGLKFSSMMLAFSGGNLVLALLMVLIASLILGMGLPVTASYIVLIVLVGPALTAEFGVPLLIAHLVVFWYSQDSNVTPPIALAGFAGAAIAGSKPMETGFQAWKFAKGLYLIPLFMVFNPEIIIGGPVLVVAWNAVIALLALCAFAASLEGYLFTRMSWLPRLAIGGAIFGVFYPSLWTEIAGVVVMVVAIAANWQASKREAAPAAG